MTFHFYQQTDKNQQIKQDYKQTIGQESKMFHFHPGSSFNIFTMDSRVWRPTNNQNIWILKIPQCSFGKNVQRRHMMLFGAQFRTCGILGKNDMEWQNYLNSPKIKNGAMRKQNAFIFIFPPSHSWFGRSGRGRKGRSKFSVHNQTCFKWSPWGMAYWLLNTSWPFNKGLANLGEYSGKIKMVKERLISIPRQNDLKVSLPPLVQKKGSKYFMGW